LDVYGCLLGVIKPNHLTLSRQNRVMQNVKVKTSQNVQINYQVASIGDRIFYHLLCEQLMQGQSFGKRAMQVKVVKTDGSQPKFSNYFIRWILRIIDSFPYWGVGICSILFSEKSQRLGDLGANTIVIKLKPEVSAEDTIFAQVDSEHIVRYQNVLRLTDRDVELIKSIMNRSYENPEILAELSTKIRTVIEAPEDELLPTQFLKQVLKDYNYQCVYGS